MTVTAQPVRLAATLLLAVVPPARAAADAVPAIGIGVRLVELRLALGAALMGLQTGVGQAWSGLAPLPGEIAAAAPILLGRDEGATVAGALALLALSLGLGGLGAWLARRRLAGLRRDLAHPAEAPGIVGRLGRLAGLTFLDLLAAAACGAGALSVVLLATVPGTRVQELLVTYATGAVAALLLAAALDAALAPAFPALRLLPVGSGLARWLRRWLLLVGTVGLTAWLTAGLLIRSGFTRPAHLALVMLTGLLLALLAAAMILAGRRVVAAALLGGADPLTGRPPGRLARRFAAAWQVPALALVAALWAAWSARILADQASALWPALASLLLLLLAPAADRGLTLLLLRLAGSDPVDPAAPRPARHLAVLRRAGRCLIGGVAALGVLELWDASPLAPLGLGMGPVVLRAAAQIAATLLLAGTAWALARAAIDPHLVQVARTGGDEARATAQTTRAQTLLPLLRGLVVVLLVAATALTVLRALGVDTAPLLAGAGVVGIAVGFGAQTLVKDIVSGIFFLVDDAFRLGEYVDVGLVKGTVERITLRSLHLRHHRGAVNVVPFGELKAIVNHSRDWVIDKIDIGVAHETDIAAVKRLVKQVSADLMADPELAAVILEPLKSQGVSRIGDYNLQVRLKVVTRPGEQFKVRRAAYDAIKRAFAANDVRFVNPLAALAGGLDAGQTAAAAAAA